jgi:hypothetical protein
VGEWGEAVGVALWPEWPRSRWGVASGGQYRPPLWPVSGGAKASRLRPSLLASEGGGGRRWPVAPSPVGGPSGGKVASWAGVWLPFGHVAAPHPKGVASGVLVLWPESGPAPGVV